MKSDELERLKRAVRKAARRSWLLCGLSVLRNPRYLEAYGRVWLAAREAPSAASCARLAAALLEHARRRVPFYRQTVPATGELSLADFPILTKPMLRERFSDLIDENPSGPGPLPRGLLSWLEISSTSGSTGYPLRRLGTMMDYVQLRTVGLRVMRAYGVPRVGDVINVSLHPRATPTVQARPVPGLYTHWNLRKLTADPQRIREYVQILSAVDPVAVTGAPSRLADLARVCLRYGLEKRPHVATYTHEMALESDRRLVEDTFRCPLVSTYATSETGHLGWACRLGHQHFEPDIAVVEVVDDAGRAVAPGGTGRLLVTHLRNALMPLIRYDTGDLAVAARAQACPCGRATPWVERLVGRARVEFHTTSGRAVEAYSLMRMCDLLSLSSYQLVQEVPGQLRVILEREAPVRSDLADVLGRQISAHAGEAFQVRVDLTGDFVLTELGKKNPTVRLRAP